MNYSQTAFVIPAQTAFVIPAQTAYVIPAKAGIQFIQNNMGPRLRGDDEEER
jgi:hypothetical protein